MCGTHWGFGGVTLACDGVRGDGKATIVPHGEWARPFVRCGKAEAVTATYGGGLNVTCAWWRCGWDCFDWWRWS